MKFFSENHSGDVNIHSGPDRFSYPFGTGIHIHIASESVFTSPRNQYSHAPESALTDIEALLLSREMGYTGAALKACKQQSQAMLMAAVGQKNKMFLCVQDLTCPGASLIQSASL
ncbi:MAG: hypothetical protein ACR2OE_09630, partial [Thermomicrobiales bacterium]